MLNCAGCNSGRSVRCKKVFFLLNASVSSLRHNYTKNGKSSWERPFKCDCPLGQQKL